MIALLIGVSAVMGVGVGWYGHKTGLRVAAWGRNANEVDAIFLATCIHEDDLSDQWTSRTQIVTNAAATRSASPLLTVGAAASK